MNFFGDKASDRITRWALVLGAPVLVWILGRALVSEDFARLAALGLVWAIAALLLWHAVGFASALDRAERDLAIQRKDLTAAQDQLRETARNDSLTGVANHWFMYEMLRQEWGRAERTGAPLALVITDFDGFDEFMDQNPPGASDRLLRQAAGMMARELKRPGDLLARLGGRRFLALLPDTDLEGAAIIANRLRSAVLGLEMVGEAGELGFSAGVAVRIPSLQKDENELLEAARTCLARCKKAGGNQVVTLDLAS